MPTNERSQYGLSGIYVTGTALFASLLLLIVGFLVYAVIAAWVGERIIPSDTLLPDIVAYVTSVGGFRDIVAQKTAFLSWFFLLWGTVAIILFTDRPVGLPSSWNTGRTFTRVLRRNPLIFLGGLAALWLVEVLGRDSLIRAVPGWAFWTGVGCVFLIAWAHRLRVSRRVFSSLVALVFVAALTLLLVGLFQAKTMAYLNPAGHHMVSAHYALLAGMTEKLSSGQILFKDVSSFYGILPSSLTAAYELWGGTLDWGVFLSTIRVLQALMGLSLVIVLIRFSPSRPAKANIFYYVLIPLLLVLPFVYAGNGMNWYPNQTGWRFIGFSLLILSAVLTRGWGQRASALALGAVSAVNMIINIETGIVTLVGAIALVVTRIDRPRLVPMVKAAFWLLPGMLGAFGAFLLFYRLAFSTWVPLEDANLLSFVILFNQGFGSLLMSDIDALAILIFGHVAYVIIRNCLIWKDRPLSDRQRIQLAIAATVSVWMSYYVNRPQTLNLWSQTYLYTLLLGSLLDGRRLSLAWQGWRLRPMPLMLPAILVMGLISYQGVEAIKWSWSLHKNRVKWTEGAGENLSGIWLQKDYAERVTEQSNYLKALKNRDDVVYFTPAGFILPLISSVRPHVSVRDPFWEALSRQDQDLLVEKVKRLAPPLILFDAVAEHPEFIFGNQDGVRAYTALMARFAPEYRHRNSASGWDIWERVEASPESGAGQ